MSDPIDADQQYGAVGFRLSPQQSRLMALAIGDSMSSIVVETNVEIDPDRMRRVVASLVKRLEILRTNCVVIPGYPEPVQQIGTSAVVEVSVARRASGSQLTVELPATAADAATLRLVVAEVLDAYDGRPGRLPGDSLQYADVAAWLNELVEEDEIRSPSAAWAEVGEVAEASPAPVLRPEPVGAVRLSTVAAPAPIEDQASWLLASGAISGLAADDLVRAALVVAWWRRSGSERFLLAEVMPGRTHVDLEVVAGPVARHIPIVCDIDPAEPFTALARRLAAKVAAAGAWQDHFDWRSIRYPRTVDGTGFVDLAFEPGGSVSEPTIGGARATIVSLVAHVDRFVWKLSTRSGSQGLEIEVHRDEAAVELDDAMLLGELVARVLAVVAGLLEVGGEETLVGDLDLTSSHDLQRALELGSGPPLAHEPACLHDLLRAQATRTPDRTAVVFDGRSSTFADLDRRSDEIARALIGLGVCRGELVGILARPSCDLIAVIFGVLKAGAAYVPLDTTAPPARTAASLLEAGLGLVVADPSLASGVASSAVATWWVDQIERGDTEAPARLPDTAPDDAAYAIFTSGSTGRPKAVVVEHRNVDALRSAMKEAIPDLRPGRPLVAALNASVTFDASVQQLALLLDGHTLHVLSDEVRRDDSLLVSYVREHKIEVLNGTPTQVNVLVASGLLEASEQGLRALLIAGERLPAGLWTQLAADGRIAAYNIYGPTECTVNATAALIEPGIEPSIGSPLAMYDVRIVDGRLGLVPPGCPGEICLGGRGVARGYLGRPGLTAAHFLPDPWGPPGSRMYRTGDIARFERSGHLVFEGRRDHQVKLRGFRIEPAEIESILLHHDAVTEAAVVLHEAADDGHASLVAYVAPAASVIPVLDDLRNHVAGLLPPHMVPATIVPLDRLPQTVTGKTDRRSLPAPHDGARGVSVPYVPPRNATEEALVEIWSTVLGGRVGIDDRFFSIGGDSIRSISIRNLAAEAGLALTVQQLFEHQTVRSLAEHCIAIETDERLRSLAPFALVPAAAGRVGIDAAFPVASMQSNMLYHEALDLSRPMFRSTRTMRLRGVFDADALRAALRDTAADHPILRTTLDLTTYDEPVQLVHRDLHPGLMIRDLRHIDPVAQEEQLVGHWAADSATAFDLAAEPLARITVHRIADEESHFGITVHQAAFDGWSVASLLNELFRRYVAHLEGASLRANPPAVTFASFVEAERAASADAASRAVWRSEAERGVGIVLPLIQGTGPGASHQTVMVPLPAGLAAALEQIARRAGVPLRSVLLGVHLRVVASLTGSSVVRTGVVTHGRPETADGERILGQFLNTIPFALELDGRSWTDLARQIFDHEVELRPHRRYPVALMERDAGGPLFDTVFNFTHFHVHAARVPEGLDLVADDFDELTDIGLLADFSLDPRSQELRLTLAVARLDEERAAALARQYTAALGALAAGPDQPHEVVFSGTSVGPPSLIADEDLGTVLARNIGQFGDEIAVTAPSETMTYAELDELSGRIQAVLLAAGAGADSIVALRGRRGPRMVAAIVGVLRSGAGFFIVDHDSAEEEEDLAAQASAMATLDVDDQLPDDGALCPIPEPTPVGSRGIAYLVATSGTTGPPRLVVVERDGLLNHLRAKLDLLELGPASIVAQSARCCFDVSVWQQLAVLLVGGTVSVIPDEVMADPSGYLRAVAEVGATHAQIVPSVLAASIADGLPAVPLPSLLVMVSTGDALTLRTARRWAARYPDITLVNAYGPAEVTDQSTQAIWQPDLALCPIGWPIAGVRTTVGDDRGRPVSFPGCGEVYLAGVQLARGYLGDPAATADRFRPDPDGYGTRRYLTGDFVRTLADGGLEFIGRRDRQVRISGIRVEPAGVEAILGALPGIRELAVVLVDNGGQARLAACVAADGVSSAELTVLARRCLPRVAVPTRYQFVEQLPRTPAGKIDRAALQAIANGAPVEARPVGRSARTRTERALQSCWSSVLERSVGIDDDFFDVGGDSFAAVRVAAHLAADHQIECRVIDIIEGRTIANIAERIGL